MRETEDRRGLLNFILYKLLPFEVFTLEKQKLVIYPHMFTLWTKLKNKWQLLHLRKVKPSGKFPWADASWGILAFHCEGSGSPEGLVCLPNLLFWKEAWATLGLAFLCWLPNPQGSTKFVFYMELACRSNHSLDRGMVLGFPKHELLSLLGMEEIGKYVFNHRVLSLRQGFQWIRVKVNSVVGIPPFHSSSSLASWSEGRCGKLWGQWTLNFTLGGEQLPMKHIKCSFPGPTSRRHGSASLGQGPGICICNKLPRWFECKRITEAHIDRPTYRTTEKQNAPKWGMTDARCVCKTRRNRKNWRMIVTITGNI